MSWTCPTCGAALDGETLACGSCGFAPERRDGFLCFSPRLANDSRSFDVASFIGLAAAEENSFWFPPRNALIQWVLSQYFPQAQSLLELGCGTGFVLQGIREAFPKMVLSGADIYVEGLAEARKRLGDSVDFHQVDGLALPFTSRFDVTCAFDVVEHIDDDVEALRQMAKATRPGGGVLAIVPQHKFMWSRVDELACHRRRYTRKEVERAAARAGLEVIRILSFGALTLPLQIISRMVTEQKGDTLAEILELHMAKPVQDLLKGMLDFERATIAKGVNYPFGASLFLIARKR